MGEDEVQKDEGSTPLLGQSHGWRSIWLGSVSAIEPPKRKLPSVESPGQQNGHGVSATLMLWAVPWVLSSFTNQRKSSEPGRDEPLFISNCFLQNQMLKFRTLWVILKV